MSQTALHCIAMYTFWFSSFQYGQGGGKDGWDGKRPWCRQSDLFTTLSEPLAEIQRCWISVLGRSLSIIPLKQTSSYLVTPPNALSTIKAEILSFILPGFTFIDVLANTVKEDLLDFQVTRAAPAVCWS